MQTEIIVAVITGVVTLAGVFIQNYRHNETITTLIEYRLKELEKKQDKHNGVIERMYEVEKKLDVLEEKQKVANNRIQDLERS